jgi:hypothetical protein
VASSTGSLIMEKTLARGRTLLAGEVFTVFLA